MNTKLGYDEAALKKGLREWWDGEVNASVGPLSGKKDAAGTIFDPLPDMDSLSALKGLMTVEEFVPFEVPPTVIRSGGYYGFDDMCEDILPKVRALVEKHAAQEGQNAASRLSKTSDAAASASLP